MKHAITTALLLAGAAGMANAQASTLTFEATVIDIVDRGGHFDSVQIGDRGVGSFALDFDAMPNADDWGDDMPPPFLSFDAESLEVAVNDLVFTGLTEDAPYPGAAIVSNNILFEIPDEPSDDWFETNVFDLLEVYFALPGGSDNPFVSFASVSTRLVALGDWIEGMDSIPNPATHGLENLATAEVVIEFYTADEGYSAMTLAINTLANADGTIATIGCRSHQYASPIAEFNFFDVSEFISAFSSNDSDADMNGDGQLNFFDVSDFINEIQTGCSN